MTLTYKQIGVLRGMAIGITISISIIIFGAWYNPFSYRESINEVERLSTAIKSIFLPAIFLLISVARLAKHRFFSPEDIDGGAGFSADSEYAKYLQTLLQNTLEQFCIAFVAYLAWAVVMPAGWLSVIPLAGICFSMGRIMFFKGYMNGAPSRALGFALTFYPSLLMLVSIAGAMVWHIFS